MQQLAHTLAGDAPRPSPPTPRVERCLRACRRVGCGSLVRPADRKCSVCCPSREHGHARAAASLRHHQPLVLTARLPWLCLHLAQAVLEDLSVQVEVAGSAVALLRCNRCAAGAVRVQRRGEEPMPMPRLGWHRTVPQTSFRG